MNTRLSKLLEDLKLLTDQETLEILADPELMEALRQSIREVAEGKLIPWEDARKELGL